MHSRFWFQKAWIPASLHNWPGATSSACCGGSGPKFQLLMKSKVFPANYRFAYDKKQNTPKFNCG